MVVVRNVFQAKVGRARELAQLLAESLRQRAGTEGAPAGWRVLTDLTGPFDTVVLEIEVESLGVWEQEMPAMFASPEYQAMFQQMGELMVSGSRQLYTIEARG